MNDFQNMNTQFCRLLLSHDHPHFLFNRPPCLKEFLRSHLVLHCVLFETFLLMINIFCHKLNLDIEIYFSTHFKPVFYFFSENKECCLHLQYHSFLLVSKLQETIVEKVCILDSGRSRVTC